MNQRIFKYQICCVILIIIIIILTGINYFNHSLDFNNISNNKFKIYVPHINDFCYTDRIIDISGDKNTTGYCVAFQCNNDRNEFMGYITMCTTLDKNFKSKNIFN